MIELYIQFNREDLAIDGTPESDLVVKTIAGLYPDAVWKKDGEGWRIMA